MRGEHGPAHDEFRKGGTRGACNPGAGGGAGLTSAKVGAAQSRERNLTEQKKKSPRRRAPAREQTG